MRPPPLISLVDRVGQILRLDGTISILAAASSTTCHGAAGESERRDRGQVVPDARRPPQAEDQERHERQPHRRGAPGAHARRPAHASAAAAA